MPLDPDYALFAEVAGAGSISAAARALDLSPAMVSKRLARLEARLGVRLVHRTTRRLSLTAPGERFLGDVRAILASVAEAEARLTGETGRLSGPLRITAPTSFGRLHIAPHLGRFVEAHPQVAIDLELSDGFVDLVADRIDCAVRITPAIEPHLVGHRLGTSGRVLCAAPVYRDRHGAPATIAELGRHPLLAATGQLPWRLTGPRGPVTVDGTSRVRTNSSEVVRELTLAGLGIALRSLWDVAPDLAAGRLVRVLPDHRGSAEVGIFAVHPRSPFVPPVVAAFTDFLRALPCWGEMAG